MAKYICEISAFSWFMIKKKEYVVSKISKLSNKTIAHGSTETTQ
jgi:hypothetical protein